MKYISAQKSQLLDSLENQVLFADLASVIIGKKGFGKSFLLSQLNIRLNDKVYISEITADAVMTPEQLNKSICLQLGLSWQSTQKELLSNIQTNIDKRVLLSIDDAHLFSIECLNFILSLLLPQNDEQQKPIYVVLTGEAILANKLNSTEILQAHPNICVVFELEPFTCEETKFFIAELQGLEVAKVEVLYDEQKLSYFWQLSLGNPKELASQLERWLAGHKDKKQSKFLVKLSTVSLRQYLLAGVYSIIAFCLITVLIFQDQINQSISPKHENSVEILKLEPSNLPAKGEMDDAVKSYILTDVDNEEMKKPPLHDNSLKIEEVVMSEKPDQPENIADLEKQSVESAIKKSIPLDIKLDIKQPVVKTPINLDSTLSNVKKQQFKYEKDEQKLLKLNEYYFTLQWMGLSSLSSAQAFKSSHPLKDEIYIFRRKYKNNYLYLLVSGEYKTQEIAMNAKTQFEARNYPGKPWVKSIKAVKKEILELN